MLGSGRFNWVDRAIDNVSRGRRIDNMPSNTILFNDFPDLKTSHAEVVLGWNEKAITIRLNFVDWLDIARGGTIKTRFRFEFKKHIYEGVVTFKEHRIHMECNDGEVLWSDTILKAIDVHGPAYRLQDLAVLVLQGGINGFATDEEDAKNIAEAREEYEREKNDPNRKLTLGDLPLCDDINRARLEKIEARLRRQEAAAKAKAAREAAKLAKAQGKTAPTTGAPVAPGIPGVPNPLATPSPLAPDVGDPVTDRVLSGMTSAIPPASTFDPVAELLAAKARRARQNRAARAKASAEGGAKGSTPSFPEMERDIFDEDMVPRKRKPRAPRKPRGSARKTAAKDTDV